MYYHKGTMQLDGIPIKITIYYHVLEKVLGFDTSQMPPLIFGQAFKLNKNLFVHRNRAFCSTGWRRFDIAPQFSRCGGVTARLYTPES